MNTIQKIKAIEITEDGQEILLCQGGYAGRGNSLFKGPTNTTPVEAEYGTFGEKKIILLELRLVADIGLIGFPNAGKSTLLSIVTKANPKIANYPFTTLEPNLGVMAVTGDFSSTVGKDGSRDVVLADIPGLIEGASEGKGLGFEFLRHVQTCKALLFLLTLEESIIFDDALTPEEKAQQLFDQFKVLEGELKNYNTDLAQKPKLLSISKADLYAEELQEAITKLFKKKKYELSFFSTITQKGIEDLKRKIVKTLELEKPE